MAELAYRKILLLLNTSFLNVDRIWSSLVLGKLLAQKYNVSIDVFTGNLSGSRGLAQQISPTGLTFLERFDEDHFTIAVKRNNARVREVKWEETADKLNLLIYTERGAIDTDKYAVIPGKPEYQLVVAVGFRDKETLSKQLGTFASVLNIAEVLNLDLRSDNTKFGDSNWVMPEVKTTAELVTNYALANKLSIKPTEATELLAALYWRTNSLRNRSVSFRTAECLKSLLEAGADNLKATAKIYHQRSAQEQQMLRQIWANLTFPLPEVAISKIDAQLARELQRQTIVHPEPNPLVELKEAVVSYVLWPLGEQQTLVLASTKATRLNLRKIFAAYKVTGDAQLSEISIPLALTATQQQVINLTKQALKDPSAESSKPADSKPSGSAPKPASQPEKPADPLPIATEKVKPDPAPVSTPPQPMFGMGAAPSSGNPFGPV